MERTRNLTAATVRKRPSRLTWLIILAERDAGGEWRASGSPPPNVDFDDQALAYAYAQRKNKQWNAKFDWADDEHDGKDGTEGDGDGHPDKDEAGQLLMAFA